MLDKVMPRFLDAWQAEADLKTYRQAVAEEIVFGVSQGETFELTAGGVAGVLKACFVV